MNKVEILAPAGSITSMQASFKAGADAVYMGGSRFGARAYADNPVDDELLRAIDYAHLRGKRLYLTVNTLVKESELNELYTYLKPLYLHGLDAVIVQDLGVLQFVTEHFWDLPVHISTQMSLTTGEAGKMLGKNVTRVVPARELTIDEIASMKKETGLEMEVFVHGALCYSYSGQCLLSSACGDRSGNRGRCAQPCRKRYILPDGEKNYILSPKDICTLDNIPELIEAGVDSFKIEGRMKSPQYACGVTEIYRWAVDLYYKLGKAGYKNYIRKHESEWQAKKLALADLFNRGGFSKGYAFEKTGKRMMSVDRPNHDGVYAGDAVIKKGFAHLVPVIDLNKGDVLEIRSSGKEEWYSYTTPVEYSVGCALRFKALGSINKGVENKSFKVYRMRNEKLLTELTGKYVNGKDYIPVKGSICITPGSEMVMQVETTLVSGEEVTAMVTGMMAGEAINAPLTEKSVEEKIIRSKDSDFVFEDFQVMITGSPFVPKSALGEIRRNALDTLAKEICEAYRRSETTLGGNAMEQSIGEGKKALGRSATEQSEGEGETAFGGSTTEQFAGEDEKACRCIEFIKYEEQKCRGTHEICCFTITVEQYKSCISSEVVSRVVLDMDYPVYRFFSSDAEKFINEIKKVGKKLYFRTAHIADRENLDELRRLIRMCGEHIDGFYVTNLSAAAVLKECLEEKKEYTYELMSGKNLYCFNSKAENYFLQNGFSGFIYAGELSRTEIEAVKNTLVEKGESLCDQLNIYGREKLMVSAQCIKNSRCKCNKTAEWINIISENRDNYKVYTDCFACKNHIYSDECVNLTDKLEEIDELGIRLYGVEFTIETGVEAEEVLTEIANKTSASAGGEFLKTAGTQNKQKKYNNFGHFYRPVQ